MTTTMPSPFEVRQRITDPDWEVASRSLPVPPRTTLTGGQWPVVEYLFCGGQIKITVEGESPAWMLPAVQDLDELLELGPDWDSYGARPIDPRHVVAALTLLSQVMRNDTPPPTVVPTSDGGVQLEWHTCGIDLEIRTVTASRFHVSFEDSVDGDEEDRELMYDMTLVAEYLDRLSRRIPG